MGLITFRTPKTLGCAVISTAVLQSLRNFFPDDRFVVYTEAPDLFDGLEEIDQVLDISQDNFSNYNIDLSDYLKIYTPQTNMPLRHLKEHLFEVTEKQLQINKQLNRDFDPKINLLKSELIWAQEKSTSLGQGKPLVWLQTKSREKEKQISDNIWQEFITRMKDQCTFIDLSDIQFSRREAISLTKYCKAGITLDTFLLHGSHAVEAKNVIVVLVTTHPEVVCYSDQTVLNSTQDKKYISAESIVSELKKKI